MLNRSVVNKIGVQYTKEKTVRRKIIAESNEILSLAKRAIFALHRGELSEADKHLRVAEKGLNAIEKHLKISALLRYEGAYRAALEEYAEATLFNIYLKTGKVGKIDERAMDPHIYIGGLSDFTGEVVRAAVAAATNGKVKEVEKMKNIVADVQEFLLGLDITGKLRSKFDQVKRNLHKMEEIMYDLTIKRR